MKTVKSHLSFPFAASISEYEVKCLVISFYVCKYGYSKVSRGQVAGIGYGFILVGVHTIHF